PLVPMALASRNRDIVARMSWLKTGRFSIDVASTPAASRFDAVSVLTSAAALPTVTSWAIAASGNVTRNGAIARVPTVRRTVVGRNPSKVTRRSYRPGATWSKWNAPVLSAFVDSWAPPAGGFN